jgi:hypothetical protein
MRSSDTGRWGIEENVGADVGQALVPDTSLRSRLWTPASGPSGLIVVPRPRPLIAVVGGHVMEVHRSNDGVSDSGATAFAGRLRQVMLGGLVIVSNSRQKEPTRVIGHPDLASGASVQRGETLYVSVAEAIYRESRGEEVEVHLTPTPEDNDALGDLRTRARQRWENDRLPDGWTRPLPPLEQQLPSPSKENSLEMLPEELRELAERIRAKEKEDENV